jgi:hypothetical protein
MPHWNANKLNIGNALVAVYNPFVSEYYGNGQYHVAYIAAERDKLDTNSIMDVWYNPFPRPGKWSPQRIDIDNNPHRLQVTAGPSVGVYRNQQHFCYIRGGYDQGFPNPGEIWDAWYDGSGNWSTQQIDVIAQTPGAAWSPDSLIVTSPLNVLGPFLVSIWTWDDQQHFTYLTYKNEIWDA